MDINQGAEQRFGETALIEGNWDAAISAGRVALKIAPNDNSARMVLSRAYFGKGIFDLAQKFAEDAVASEPTSIAAKELLAGISLRQAFRALTLAGDRDRTLGTVSTALKAAANGRLKGILAVSDEPLVSIDFRGNANSSIVDAPYTKVMDGDFLKVLSWYDNEWGYSSRCVDLLTKVLIPRGL